MFHNRQVLTIPTLIWIRTGRAHIQLERDSFDLSAGQGVFCPAGNELSLTAEDNSVVIPIQLPTERNITLSIIEISEYLGERLMYDFAQNLGYLKEDPQHLEFLHALLTAISAGSPLAPPLPRNEQALKVAREIIAHPASTARIAELADQVKVSERTLQRRFHDETGMSFSLWRTRTRLSLAMSYLSDGHSAEWAAHHVGFSGASSLSKALRTHAGINPGQVKKFGHISTRDMSHLEVTGIPASTTWTRINGSHIMVWAYKGTSTAQVAGREIVLDEGDVLILPAGMRLDVLSPAGSLLLPVGFSTPTTEMFTAEQLRLIHYTGSRDVLLNCAVFTYTSFGPSHHHSDRAFTLLDHHRSTLKIAERTREALRAAVRITSEDQVNRALSHRAHPEAFATSTGTDFQQWGVIRRMTLARIQLSRGIAPSVVARNLGYSHLPAFSRAFSTAHGVSPTRFQNTTRQVIGPLSS